MADSPPVTRKRGRHNDTDRAVTRERRTVASDWRESLRNARQEEQEKAVADKRKKLLRPIPTTIPGVSAVLRGDARSDIREIEALVDMQVLEPEEMAPGAVQATPRPPMPKTNQLEPKRARMERWRKDPSEMKKDMDKQREALARAEKDDAQLEEERDAWERWYLVLRAHLTASRRPTATWSPAAAAAAAASSATAPHESPVSAVSVVESDDISEKDNNNAASAVVAAVGARGSGGGSSSNGSATGDCSGKGDGAIDPGIVRAGGEEEEEEERVKDLQAVVMKRAGLEGEFDMSKVLNVLAGCSRDAMSARREHVALVASQSGEPKAGADAGAEHEKEDEVLPHPGDEGSLRRWEELLRSVDVNGGRWQSDQIGGISDVASGMSLDDMGINSSTADGAGASSREGHRQERELLVPKGLDLLPSMRAPRRLTRSDASMSNGAAEDEEMTATTIEFVPLIGGSASLNGVKPGHASRAAMAAPVQAADGIRHRLQWFPRGLPKETSPAGGGQDERESALFNTRASVAIDRLAEQVEETTRRQAEMEARRREKVEEAVHLVRAAAEHEKLRQLHLRRMKSLREHLESLVGTKHEQAENAKGRGDQKDATGAGKSDADGDASNGTEAVPMAAAAATDDDDDVDDSDGDSDVQVSTINGRGAIGDGDGEAATVKSSDAKGERRDSESKPCLGSMSPPPASGSVHASPSSTCSYSRASPPRCAAVLGAAISTHPEPGANGAPAAAAAAEAAEKSESGENSESESRSELDGGCEKRKGFDNGDKSDEEDGSDDDDEDDEGNAGGDAKDEEDEDENEDNDDRANTTKSMSEDSDTEAGRGGGKLVGAKGRASAKNDQTDDPVEDKGAEDGDSEEKGVGAVGGVFAKRRGLRGLDAESSSGVGGAGGGRGRRRRSADATISASGAETTSVANGENRPEERSSPRAAAAAAAAAEGKPKQSRAGGKRAYTSRFSSRRR